MRPSTWAALLLLLTATASEARRGFRPTPPPAPPSVLEHGFGGAPAFRLEVPAIAGDVHEMRGDGRLLDFADYSSAGSLVVHRTLALGPLPSGPALVPPGEYALSLSVSGPEGLPVLGLVSAEGLRLRLPLVAAPRPAERPQRLAVVALDQGATASVSLPVALHLPTASGLLLVGPVDMLVESPLQRRRSRTHVIQEEMQRRALESGHVRSLERRKPRTK